jgi:hypothetical protein
MKEESWTYIDFQNCARNTSSGLSESAVLIETTARRRSVACPVTMGLVCTEIVANNTI